MAGLENLLSEIQSLAQEEAARILRSAEMEAEKIREENRAQIKSRTEEILAKAKAEAKSITERGASNQIIRRRGETLALKQELFRAVVKKAKERAISLPDAEYFGLLKGWAACSGISGKTVVHLNARDLARDKGDFPDSFPKGADATLSEEPADISGGFLAVCGGVTVNCSIESVFEIHADEIQGELQRILFG